MSGPSAPIPPFAEANALKAGYRDWPLDLAAPENAEPLVDLTAYGIAGRNHYAAKRNPPYDGPIPGAIEGLYLRRGAAERLAGVNERLAGEGLELFVFDAWRPNAVQAYFHETWFPDWLRRQRPELSEGEIAAMVPSYWAAPTSDPLSPAPHLTGGAVDLTLSERDTGVHLYMGGIFDDVTESAHTDHFERRALGSMSDIEARASRRLLFAAMSAAGFVNNPTEWWHYSHGDQMWAKMTGRPAALYGAASP